VCCPPCLSRTLLRVPDYVYAQTDQDLYVNLYVGSEAEVAFPEGRIRVRQETAYPGDGRVRLLIGASQPVWFALHCRVPGWCLGNVVRLLGEAQPVAAPEAGYGVIRREWRDGDVVEVELPMPILRLEAHPKVTAVQGRVALQRGPLVYGFEGLDNGGDVDIELAADPAFSAEAAALLLGGVTAIRGTRADGRPCRALPFHVLANRAQSSQVVWVRQQGKGDTRMEGWEGMLYRPWQPRPWQGTATAPAPVQ
jgi:hypothetical protein